MRVLLAISVALLAVGCGSEAPKSAVQKPPAHAKITQFYAPVTVIPKGLKGTLCYGVENASRVELQPAIEDVYPAVSRCIEIAPRTTTTYTLTAYGEDGGKETKSVEVSPGAAPPRLYDLWVNSIDVRRGEDVKVCFKVENVRSVKVSAGKLENGTNCLDDRPTKTTIYKITALGGDNQVDTGTVTVKVR
jgi:hypothetical protein